MVIKKALSTLKGDGRERKDPPGGRGGSVSFLLLGFASEELLWALHLLGTKASSILSFSKGEMSTELLLLTEGSLGSC